MKDEGRKKIKIEKWGISGHLRVPPPPVENSTLIINILFIPSIRKQENNVSITKIK